MGPGQLFISQGMGQFIFKGRSVIYNERGGVISPTRYQIVTSSQSNAGIYISTRQQFVASSIKVMVATSTTR